LPDGSTERHLSSLLRWHRRSTKSVHRLAPLGKPTKADKSFGDAKVRAERGGKGIGHGSRYVSLSYFIRFTEPTVASCGPGSFI
jgi:hypothetical protein